MTKKFLTAALVLLSTFIFSWATFAYNDNIVASLDNEDVTVAVLTTYVNDVTGKNYEPWLREKEGLRKLADFYINRTLLLDYAKKTVNKKDTIVTNHNARSMDADVMLLSSLLQSEVQDKVQVSAEDVRAYMNQNNITSEKLARQEMESDLKGELIDDLVKKVRAGHKIQYFN